MGRVQERRGFGNLIWDLWLKGPTSIGLYQVVLVLQVESQCAPSCLFSFPPSHLSDPVTHSLIPICPFFLFVPSSTNSWFSPLYIHNIFSLIRWHVGVFSWWTAGCFPPPHIWRIGTKETQKSRRTVSPLCSSNKNHSIMNFMYLHWLPTLVTVLANVYTWFTPAPPREICQQQSELRKSNLKLAWSHPTVCLVCFSPPPRPTNICFVPPSVVNAVSCWSMSQ